MGVNNLPRVVNWQWSGRESNLWPLDHKSNALTATLPSHPEVTLKTSVDWFSPVHNSIVLWCCRELANILKIEDYEENHLSAILLDLYYYTLQFARDNQFTKDQTSAFFSIVKRVHEAAVGRSTHCHQWLFISTMLHRRRSSVNFVGQDIFAGKYNICTKILHDICPKMNKIP